MSWLENIWLKILELRGEILAGIFAACVFILLLANGDYPFARDLSKEALGWIFVIAVLSFFLILARLGKAAFDAIKKKWISRETRLRDLGSTAMDLSRRISRRREFNSEESCLQTYRADVVSLFIDLKKEEIDTPNFRSGVSAADTVELWVGYLGSVGKFLYDGHFKEAEQLATHIIGEYEKLELT